MSMGEKIEIDPEAMGVHKDPFVFMTCILVIPFYFYDYYILSI